MNGKTTRFTANSQPAAEAKALGVGAWWRTSKPITAALQRVLAQNDGAMLRAMAEKLIACALEGDTGAFKEIADRLQGKAPQSVEVTGSPMTITILSRDAHAAQIEQGRTIEQSE
jgi:hypothetical protein